MNTLLVIYILLFISLFLILFEFSKFKKFTFIINIIILFLLIEVSLKFNLWNLVFLSSEIWRNIIIFIIILSFFIILNLLKDFKFEIIFLYVMVLLGSLIIVTCDNLIIIYLGLELQTFSLFILISKNKTSVKGSESALKYFILGALSSGLFLLGVSFIFSTGLSLNFKEIYITCGYNNFLVQTSFTIICLSLFFKLAIFPLHFWVPDIYEGSSWEVIALISTIPKISVLSIVLQLPIYSDFFIVLASISIIIGTIGAMNQTKIKRLLAYSGISHMGFIVLGLGILSKQGYESSFVYLFIYTITMLGVFLLIMNTNFSNNYFIIELANINLINKIVSLSWLIFFISIAGVPPLSGFISKWFILNSLIEYNYLVPAFIGVLFSAIAAGYYLRIVKISYFQKKSSYLTWEYILKPKFYTNSLNDYILGVAIYFSLVLIIHPTLICSPFYLGFNYFF